MATKAIQGANIFQIIPEDCALIVVKFLKGKFVPRFKSEYTDLGMWSLSGDDKALLLTARVCRQWKENLS